jgi:hypothetical protein
VAAAAEEQKGEPLGLPELIGLASTFDWQLAGRRCCRRGSWPDGLADS